MQKNKLTDDIPNPYTCTSCGATVDRDILTVKKSLFHMFGRNGKLLKSRVVAWLCEDCRNVDRDWNLKDNKGGTLKAPSEEK